MLFAIFGSLWSKVVISLYVRLPDNDDSEACENILKTSHVLVRKGVRWGFLGTSSKIMRCR